MAGTPAAYSQFSSTYTGSTTTTPTAFLAILSESVRVGPLGKMVDCALIPRAITLVNSPMKNRNRKFIPPIFEDHETSVGQGRIRTKNAPLVWPVWEFGWSKSEGLEGLFCRDRNGGYDLWRQPRVHSVFDRKRRMGSCV